MKLLRARDLKFELSGGRSFTIPPPTIGQIRACIELDPKEDAKETPTQRLKRVTAQAEIFVLDKALLDSLDYLEVRQIWRAIIVAAHGIDPNDVAAAEELLQKKKADADKEGSAEEVLVALDEMSLAIAMHSHCTPTAVDQMPIVDASALLTRIVKDRDERARFEAAIHGLKL